MATEKKRCPRCKKRRTHCDASSHSTKFYKPDLEWEMVDGELICHICIKRMKEEIKNPDV